MFNQSIRQVMRREQLVTVTGSTTVREVARLMAQHGVSAVIVVDGQSAAGIFTECDAITRVMATDRDPTITRIDEVMTRDPTTVGCDQAFGHALGLMHDHGFRHVPVVDDGRLVGIVTARDALDPELEDFVCEANRRTSLR